MASIQYTHILFTYVLGRRRRRSRRCRVTIYLCTSTMCTTLYVCEQRFFFLLFAIYHPYFRKDYKGGRRDVNKNLFDLVRLLEI